MLKTVKALLILASVLGLLLTIVVPLLKYFSEKPTVTVQEVVIVQPDSVDLKQLFVTVLNNYDVLYPEVVYCQALLETGRFSSRIFRENYNLFGMKHPKTRPTTSTGSKYRHAAYSGFIYSILDYKHWQAFVLRNRVKPKDNHEYIQFLKLVRYAEDPNYGKKLCDCLKQEFP